jgi:hypothetical protein
MRGCATLLLMSGDVVIVASPPRFLSPWIPSTDFRKKGTKWIIERQFRSTLDQPLWGILTLPRSSGLLRPSRRRRRRSPRRRQAATRRTRFGPATSVANLACCAAPTRAPTSCSTSIVLGPKGPSRAPTLAAKSAKSAGPGLSKNGENERT